MYLYRWWPRPLRYRQYQRFREPQPRAARAPIESVSQKSLSLSLSLVSGSPFTRTVSVVEKKKYNMIILFGRSEEARVHAAAAAATTTSTSTTTAARPSKLDRSRVHSWTPFLRVPLRPPPLPTVTSPSRDYGQSPPRPQPSSSYTPPVTYDPGHHLETTTYARKKVILVYGEIILLYYIYFTRRSG